MATTSSGTTRKKKLEQVMVKEADKVWRKYGRQLVKDLLVDNPVRTKSRKPRRES